MNRKHIGPIGALAVSILVALGACRNPLSLIETRPATGAASGVITVRVQRVSPRISELFSVRSASLPESSAASRAYIATDKLHFTLWKDSAVVTVWEELLDPSQEILTDLLAGDGDPQGFSAPAHAVAAGSGYTLEVALYNSLTDADSPVVGGTSLPFAVSAENSAANPLEVSITCIPLSPIALTKGVASAPQELEVAWVGNDADGLVSVGSEQWYEVELDDASDTHLFSVTPSEGSTAFVGLTVYDGAGKFVGAGGLEQSPGEPAELLLESPAGTYYIGVIDAQEEGGPLTNGPFTVVVADPDSGVDPLVGDWTLSTVDGGSPTEYGVVENITFEDDFTWRATFVAAGAAGSSDGTWVEASPGVYTVTDREADAGSGPASVLVYLSEDRQSLTLTPDGSTTVFVRGTTLLPPTELSFTDLTDDTSPKVELQWTPSLSPEVTEYLIMRRGSLEEQQVQIAQVDGTESSYLDELVERDAPYYYTVVSSDGSQVSPISPDEILVTPGSTGTVVIEIE